MNRRTALQVVSTGAVGLLGGCAGRLSETISGGEPEPSKEFGFGSNGFKRVEWTADNNLAVTVSEDHNMDGLGVRYHAKDSIEDDIVVQEAPDYGGTAELNFFGSLADGDNYPPAGKYNLVAYKGEFNGIMNLAEETIGSVNFQIQPEVEVVTASVTSEGRLSLQLRNSGNAPVFIDRATVNEQQFPVKNFVEYEKSAMMTSGTTGFLRNNCVEVPSELNLRLQTIPSLDVEETVETRDDVPNSC